MDKRRHCKPDSIAVINQPDKPFDMVLHLATIKHTSLHGSA